MNARVNVSLGAKLIASVMTGDAGEFAAIVPAGEAVSVLVTKAGYARTTVGPSPRQREREPLRVEMARGSVIAGRVLDAHGAPGVAWLPVLVYKLDDPGKGDQTDASVGDTDEFRAWGLAAGRYAVGPLGAAAQLRQLTADSPIPSGPGLVHARVVDVGAGEEVRVDVVYQENPRQTVPPPRPGTSSIHGRVVDERGQPMAGASASARTSAGSVSATTTDALGNFIIRGVRPGQVTVGATRPGYRPVDDDQGDSGRPGRTLTVREGRDVTAVEIVLRRASTMSGTVVDERGEPFEGAEIRLQHSNRAVVRAATGAILTDDRGHFRAYGLPAGSYTLRAAIRPEIGRAPGATSVRHAHVAMYYPGTPDAGRALPLELGDSQDLQGVVMTLRRVPVVRIEGTVTTTSGAPFTGSIRLAVGSPGSLTGYLAVSAEAEGRFVVDNVAPGDYVVSAIQPASAESATEFGEASISVGDHPPEPLRIRTAPGSTVTWRLVLESGIQELALWGYSIRAAASGQGFQSMGRSTAFGPVANGTTGSLSGLSGPVRIIMSSPDEEWYLKSLFINGFDAADVPFDFGFDGREYADVEIVFARPAARIAGRAVDDRANPVRNYAAIVFPVDRERWFRGSRWLKLARPDANGEFVAKGLPPGEYFMAAVDRIGGTAESGEWQEPDVLHTLAVEARRVSLDAGETHTTSLRVIRRGR